MKNKLTIQVFQHVPFEGLGCIAEWIRENNHRVNYTRFYEKDYQLPETGEFDWLIIMGGPMGVYDEALYPWLTVEKEFIRNTIGKGKTVIGICLGSQLIAQVLGTGVYPNKQKEIGWFNVKLTKEAKTLPIFSDFDNEFTVFHWHGDTYDLPAGSIHLLSSKVCSHQAYLFNDKVLGLQFHLEVTVQSLREMLENGKHELVESENIQSANQILKHTENIETNNRKMFQILEYFLKKTTK
jgi:GMP synthase-like glutamine amidotransferase